MLRKCRCLAFGVVFAILGVVGVHPVYAQDVALDAKAKGLAHYIMAVCHDLNGESLKAVHEYEQSVQLSSREPAIHLRLGAYYARMDRLDEAVEQLKKVTEDSPQGVQAQYLLALIYSSQRKFTLAANAYEAILKHASKDNPNNIETYLSLGQLYYTQHKYADALLQFQKIVQLQPDHVEANYLLGSIYLDTHDNTKAIGYFHKVLSLDPDHDGALNSVGYMYAEEGQHLDQATKLIRRAIAIDPTNGAYYDSLGWALFKQGLNAEALMAFQKAENYISDPIIYEHMGDVYNNVHEMALASKFWRKSLHMDSHQPMLAQKLEQLEKTQAFRQEK